MFRDRSYRRRQRYRAIHRKEGILRRIGGEEYVFSWERGTPGRLAKGKIHCSCPMCRMKSYENPKISDLRRMDDAKEQMKGGSHEYDEENKYL